MRLLVVLLACNACAVNIKQSARFEPGVAERVYSLASQAFTDYMPCSLPRNVELTIKDATLKELNSGHNIFGADGFVYITEGLYDPNTNTIYLASERPDRQFVLYHELLHFFIVASPNCGKFSDVKVQHEHIKVMEGYYFAMTGRTLEQEHDPRWIYEALGIRENR